MDIKELIGVTLGTCTLERVIGRGGMGAVYLAQQSRPVRTVAVKVLIPSNEYEADQEDVFLQRFRREADTIARLEHKNILPIYEYDEAMVDGERLAYLVMPYIRGGTLRQRIDEMNRSGSHFELKVVASYINQVADALSYAHSLGVVHRDIKPGNLLFHQDGRLLLSDFGIVRLRAMPALTTAGSFLGTAEYASPEQISTNEIDFRSDIYSLGIILYELLTGAVPYTGPNAFAVMAKKLNDPVPSIRSMRPDLSEGIEAVVMKALAKNPDDRYQTATMLAADLRAAVASSASALRIRGDANNDDLTMAESAWGAGGLSPMGASALFPDEGAFPPTQPARPLPSGGPSWQQQPGQGQWPSQVQGPTRVQAQSPVGTLPELPDTPVLADEEHDAFQSRRRTTVPDAPTYQEGRRLFYYGMALIVLLLQFPVFVLLVGKTNVMMGVLVGCGINLLALAAMGFSGVTRKRNVRSLLIRCLVALLIAAIASGFLINFGERSSGISLIMAYIVLLISNLYAIRQLARVDAAKEQVEVAHVHWRPALTGALTGLLPLTIILIFALETPFSHLHNLAPLLNLYGMLFVVFIGIPTPGAVMAVRLSENIRFASLLRSSAIAGILMFVGASVIVVVWGLLFPDPARFLYDLRETWLAMLIIVAVLSVLGGLRGMLDAWVYQRIRDRNRAKNSP